MRRHLLLDAAALIAPARVEDMARGWLARVGPDVESAGQDLLVVADALSMTTDPALFTPSKSGQTAFDRLARQRGWIGGDETAALAVLRRAQFRLLRIETGGDAVTVLLRDLATGKLLPVLDHAIGPNLVGIVLVGRLAPVPDG